MFRFELTREKKNLARSASGVFAINGRYFSLVDIVREYAFFTDEVREIADLKVGGVWSCGLTITRVL